MSNIKCYKLINGLTIIGEHISRNIFNSKIKFPISVDMALTQDDDTIIMIDKFCKFDGSDDSKYNIKNNHIIVSYEPSESMIQSYYKFKTNIINSYDKSVTSVLNSYLIQTDNVESESISTIH